MKAIILAAGFATRMYPLTRDRAKPLLKVAGQPIITLIVEQLSVLPDLEEVVVVTNQRFARSFEAWCAELSTPFPVRILNDGSTEVSNRLGAIRDIEFALQHMEVNDRGWVVVAGDNLFRIDLRRCYERFMKDRRPMILVRKLAGPEEASKYNEVRLHDNGIVAQLREKPSDPKTGLAAIALYFFPPETRSQLEGYLNSGRNPDAPGHFIEWLVGETDVSAFSFEGTWFDIGALEELQKAQNAW